MSPVGLTLYRLNGACSTVPHSILLHFLIPFHSVAMVSIHTGSMGMPYRAVDGSLSPEDYLRINPAGLIPSLVVQEPEVESHDDSGTETVVTEMPAVLTYIASLVPEKHLLGRTAIQQAKAAEWMAWLSGTLHSAGFGALRRPGRFAVAEGVHGHIVAKGKETIEKCYVRIEERLQGRTFAVGENLTVVDFNLYVFWRWGLEIGVDMESQYPTYGQLMRTVERLQGVRKAMEFERKQLCFE